MPETSDALIVVDMLNTYEHPDGERLAEEVAGRIDAMTDAIANAREADMEVLYVNDHYGDWSSDRSRLTDYVLDRVPRRELVEPILPGDDDPLVLKARHSIFFQTPLEYLLGELETTRITLVGQVTEQCILYSALDAYVRHLDIRVVKDAVAPIDEELGDAALRMMERNMHTELIAAADL
jgi:nicotinamidase-related amidase